VRSCPLLSGEARRPRACKSGGSGSTGTQSSFSGTSASLPILPSGAGASSKHGFDTQGRLPATLGHKPDEGHEVEQLQSWSRGLQGFTVQGKNQRVRPYGSGQRDGDESEDPRLSTPIGEEGHHAPEKKPGDEPAFEVLPHSLIGDASEEIVARQFTDSLQGKNDRQQPGGQTSKPGCPDGRTKIGDGRTEQARTQYEGEVHRCLTPAASKPLEQHGQWQRGQEEDRSCKRSR